MADGQKIIARRYWLLTLGVAAAGIAILFLMHRPPICTCGHVELWHPAVDSGNSQHLFDLYSPSHLIHGFLFYLLGWVVLRDRPMGLRLAVAALIETAWEIAENSPFVIDRYRSATVSLGYSGDSIINSGFDIMCMIAGFLLARRLPLWASVAVCVGFELLTLALIRDNLTLNVLMLLSPIEAIKVWQQGA